MSQSFDLVVIGTGSAGTAAAAACRARGWSVAMVDHQPFGGTCALRGCDPKRILSGAAEVVDWARRMRGHGIVGDLHIDWARLMDLKRSFTDPLPGERRAWMQNAGITPMEGTARFIDRATLQVDQGPPITARYILIASGARPALLGIPGESNLVDSTAFLELARLPERVVFVGGGYISLEFAHVAVRAGAQVTVLHHGPRPLESFDADLVDVLCAATREAGVRLVMDSAVRAVEKIGAGAFRVHATGPAGDAVYEADLVVHGAGRVADLEALQLARAGVEHNRDGVAVTRYLQSVSNPAVYAAGDAAGSGARKLTPVASRDGRLAAANMLDGNREASDGGPVPSVVFTLPPLATVGLREEEARAAGHDYEVHHAETSSWYTSRRVRERFAAHKVLVDRPSGRILGAHLLGSEAPEVINLFALAMRAELTATAMKAAMFAYPTAASDLEYML